MMTIAMMMIMMMIVIIVMFEASSSGHDLRKELMFAVLVGFWFLVSGFTHLTKRDRDSFEKKGFSYPHLSGRQSAKKKRRRKKKSFFSL